MYTTIKMMRDYIMMFGGLFVIYSSVVAGEETDSKGHFLENGILTYNGVGPLDIDFLRKNNVKTIYLFDHDVSLRTLKTIEKYGGVIHLEIGVKAEGVKVAKGAKETLRKLDGIEILGLRVSNWSGSDYDFVAEMDSLASLSIFNTLTNTPAININLAESIGKSDSITSVTLYMEGINNNILQKLSLAPKLEHLVVRGPIKSDGEKRTVLGLSSVGDRKVEYLEVRFADKNE